MESFKFILTFFFLFQITELLEIRTPPHFIKWIEKKKHYLFNRNSIVLSFTYGGYGTITVDWFHNDGAMNAAITTESEKLPDGTYKGIFKSFFNTDLAGSYRVKLSNSVGVAISDKIWLIDNNLIVGDVVSIDKQAKLNGTISLPCDGKTTSIAPSEAKWLLDNKQIPANKRFIIDHDGTLHITYLMKGDFGDYGCRLSTTEGPLRVYDSSRYHLIEEMSAPEEDELKNLRAGTIPEFGFIGEKVLIECIFAGGPNIELTLLDPKDQALHGLDFDSQRGGWTIMNVAKKDEGTYKCLAQQRKADGSVIKGTQDIPLVVKQKPLFTHRPKDSTGSMGESITFHCKVIADPPAHIQWMINGSNLNPDFLPDRMSLLNNKTELKIDKLCKTCLGARGDQRVIQCNASNEFGYAYANGYLNVLEKTEIVDKIEDVEYNPEKEARFYCNAKTDPDTQLTYKWLFNDKPVNYGSINTTNSVLSLNFPKLFNNGKEYVGKWSCLVNNSYSTDIKSAYLKEKYVEAFPNWWILLLVLLLILLLILLFMLICCCLRRNRGDIYPVDEIEHKNGNEPEKELIEYGFHDYQRDALIPKSDIHTGTLSSQDRTMMRQNRSFGSSSSLAKN